MEIIVTSIKEQLVFFSKLSDAKTLGIIINIINGFKIPPVKYNNKVSCIMSRIKKLKAVLLDNKFLT